MTIIRLLRLGVMLGLATELVSAKDPVKEETLTKKESINDAKWVDLFNGKDLSGWKNVYEHGESKVVDGVIHLTGDKKFFVTTEKKFSDFELELEVMLPKVGPANSGVMFRCHVDPEAKKHKIFGYQAECDPSPRAWTGRLYDEGRRKWDLWTKEEQKTAGVRAPLGEWIKYRIVAKGEHLQVWINGKKITDIHDDKDAEGHIGIQHHGEKGKTYKFRNIKIKEIKE